MRRALNALLLGLPALVMAAIVVLAFSPAPARPQAARTPAYVFIDDVVRTKLAKDWDQHAKDPYQAERGYCVRYDTAPFADDSAYHVFAIDTPAKTTSASPDAVVYYCPAGPGYASLHVHTPTTCESETECVLGGSEAYECFPSRHDQKELDGSIDPFGLIQCDRKAVVFYFPKTKQ